MLDKIKKARRCFISQDISFTPIGRLVKTGSIEAVIDYYKNIGDDYYQELIVMQWTVILKT